MQHSGKGKPPVMLSQWSTYTSGSDRWAGGVSIAFSPRYLRDGLQWPLPRLRVSMPDAEPFRGILFPREENAERALMLKLSLARSFAHRGAPRWRWQFALLETVVYSRGSPKLWIPCSIIPQLDHPLYPIRAIYWRSLFGLTLLDIDRSGLFENDTRWLELRWGAAYVGNFYEGYNYPCRAKVFMFTDFVPSLGFGSVQPGELHLANLGTESTGIRFQGPYAGARLRLGYHFTGYAALSVFASGRRLWDETELSTLRWGVEAIGILPLEWGRWEEALHALEFMLRFERSVVQAGNASTIGNRYSVGVEWSFAREGF